MIKFLNARVLPLICFFVAVGMIYSCKKDDKAPNSGNVQLLSFGPTGAMHGDTIRFVGVNLNQVTAIDFTGAGVSQSSFIEHTSEIIRVVVPEKAEQGFVTLRTPQGDIVTKTKFNLHVAVQVNSMPAEAVPGQNITINGKYLNWATSVTFADGKTVDTFVSKTYDQLVVTIPKDAQTGPLKIFYGGTEPMEMETDDTLKLTLPAVTSLAPSPVRHQADLTINGTNLDLVKEILFSGVSTPVTSFVSQTATKIVVKVPLGAQKGKITLVALSGVPNQSTDDLNVVLPVITSLAPNPVKHQTDLTINGTNLDIVSQILFMGVSTPVTTFVSKTATKIVVKVPAATTKGKITLVANGVNVESTQELAVLLPAATAMSPNPVDPGSNLTITGTNLDLVSGVSFVGVPSTVTSFVSQSATQLVVKVPSGALKGKLGLAVKNSTVIVETPMELALNGGLPPLAPFAFAIYTDQTENGFQDWSYTATHDFNSTSIVREGTKSIKAVYADNGYQGVTFHNNTAVSMSGYTKLELSVYGEAGTNGKKLNIVLDGNYGAPSGSITLVENAWTTFSINLSSMGSPATIGEIVLQSAGWTGTVHIDHVGLR